MSAGWDWRNLPQGEPRYHVRFGPEGFEQHVSYEATNPWYPDDTVARAEYTRKAMERMLGGGSMAVQWDSTSSLPDAFRELEEFEPQKPTPIRSDDFIRGRSLPSGSVCPRCGARVIQQVFGLGCTDLSCGWVES